MLDNKAQIAWESIYNPRTSRALLAVRDYTLVMCAPYLKILDPPLERDDYFQPLSTIS